MNRTTLASVWPPTAAVAQAAGHARLSPTQAIRRKCLDCSGNQLGEVKLCEAVTCPLWPFRAGRHPYTRKGLQEVDSASCRSAGSQVPAGGSFSENGLQEADSEEGRENNGPPSPLLSHGGRS